MGKESEGRWNALEEPWNCMQMKCGKKTIKRLKKNKKNSNNI